MRLQHLSSLSAINYKGTKNFKMSIISILVDLRFKTFIFGLREDT